MMAAEGGFGPRLPSDGAKKGGRQMMRAVGWVASLTGYGLLVLLAAAPAADAAPRAVVATSPNYAGYVAGYRIVPSTLSASANFTVPALTCTSVNSGVGFWVGTFTAAPGSFSFSKHNALVLIEALCTSGTASYETFMVIDGVRNMLPVSVHSGDHVTMSVSTTGPISDGAVTVKFADSTQGYSTTQTGTNTLFECARGVNCGATAGATILENSSMQLLPVPKFGTAAFTGASLSGKTPKAANATQYNAVNSQGTVLIQTGSLNKSGKGWAETFKHS